MSSNALTSGVRNLPLKGYVAHGAIPFLKSVKSGKKKQPDRLFNLQSPEERRERAGFSGALALRSQFTEVAGPLGTFEVKAL